MPKQLTFAVAYKRALDATSLSQKKLAEKLELNVGTPSRWRRGSLPDAAHLRRLVQIVQPFDAKTAEDLAATAGSSLEALGLVKVVKAIDLDKFVLAAADAANVPPQKARAAMLATVTKMRELDVTPTELEALLRPS